MMIVMLKTISLHDLILYWSDNSSMDLLLFVVYDFFWVSFEFNFDFCMHIDWIQWKMIIVDKYRLFVLRLVYLDQKMTSIPYLVCFLSKIPKIIQILSKLKNQSKFFIISNWFFAVAHWQPAPPHNIFFQ